MFGTASLFIGAAFLYISFKAPFYWGYALYAGLALILLFAITALVGAVTLLRKPAAARA